MNELRQNTLIFHIYNKFYIVPIFSYILKISSYKSIKTHFLDKHNLDAYFRYNRITAEHMPLKLKIMFPYLLSNMPYQHVSQRSVLNNRND